MEIQVASQSNPDEMKFQFQINLCKDKRVYRSAEEAVQSPVASLIFGFPWASLVEVGPNYVLVTKQNWVSWDLLQEPLKGLLAEHFEKVGAGSEEPRASSEPGGDELAQRLATPLAQQIRDFLDREVNPGIAHHGGFIDLIDLQGEVALVEMQGGCQGCGLAGQTLRHGVEMRILKLFPEIKEVRDITDHGRGLNPFIPKSQV